MSKRPAIADSEWEVMKVLWRRTSGTAQDVIADLAEAKSWSPATVKTLLNRLHSKGAVRFEKTGKSYVYFPACREEDLRGAEADSFLSRVFDGSLSPMIAHFVKARTLSEADLRELERILKEGRRGK